MKRSVLPGIAAALAILQVVLVLLSWAIVTVMPSLPLRSLLGGEGLRWFLGTFVDNVSGCLLAWIILCSMAYGALAKSGLNKVIASLFNGSDIGRRERHALYAALCVLIAFTFTIVLLAFVPHAVLLGLSGSLFPSAFSASAVALLAFAVTVMSLTYGITNGTLTNIGDIFKSLYGGIVMAAPLFPIYVLAIQLYYSARFVFML